MNKFATLLILTAFTSITFAQEKEESSTKQQEAAIIFKSVDYFGLTYRLGKENALWRFQTVSFNGNSNRSYNYSSDLISSNIGIGVSLGREYRKLIGERIEFRYGADLLVNYSNGIYKQESSSGVVFDEQTQTRFEIGTNLILGFNYVSDKNIIVGIEMLAGIKYFEILNENKVNSFQSSSDFNNGVVYELNSSNVLLSVGYRF